MNEQTQSNTGLAVNLLLKGRRVVVVGGGAIGLRKARLLMEADAAVTIIAPLVCSEIRLLAEAKRLIHVPRPFEPEDLADAAGVFAATDDGEVNRQVLDAAHRLGVLCCAADANWPDGDFLTPASVRRGGLQVSVSSGGRSCRQSRLVKESLSRHLASLEHTGLVVVGTSHELLSAAEREQFHMTEAVRKHVGALIRQLWGVHEFFILNTCNRVEVVAAVADDDVTVGLLEKLMNLDMFDEAKRYRKSGPAAFEHLCMLTAGMLSQSVGETHITAQVKDAVTEAIGNGWANGLMREWTDIALHVSKDIRAAVGPLLRNGELEEACLAYVDQNMPGPADAPVMVIGSGVVGRALVEQVTHHDRRCVWCYHANRPEMPAEWSRKVELCPRDGLRDRLGDVRTVLSAVKAPGHVLHESDVACFASGTDVLVIDLTMPRTVDPRLDGLAPGLRVIDLDGLKHWQRLTSGVLEKVMDQSRVIIQEHDGLYERIQESIQGGIAGESIGVEAVGGRAGPDRGLVARHDVRAGAELVARRPGP